MQQGQETVLLLVLVAMPAAAAAEDADWLCKADTRRRWALGQLMVPLVVPMSALLTRSCWLALHALLSTPVLGPGCRRRCCFCVGQRAGPAGCASRKLQAAATCVSKRHQVLPGRCRRHLVCAVLVP